MLTLSSEHEATLFQHFLETIVIVHTVFVVLDGASLSLVNAHPSHVIIFKVYTPPHTPSPTVISVPCSMLLSTSPKAGVTVFDTDQVTGAFRVFGVAIQSHAANPIPVRELHVLPALVPFQHVPSHVISRDRFNTVVYTMCLGVSDTRFTTDGGALTMRTEFDGNSSITATFPPHEPQTTMTSLTSTLTSTAVTSTKLLRRVTPLIAMYKQVRVFIGGNGVLTLQCKAHDNRCEIVSQHLTK
jgi:hypothetical protein